jgi:hypothetical protein
MATPAFAPPPPGAHAVGFLVVMMACVTGPAVSGISGKPSKKSVVTCAAARVPVKKRTSATVPTNLAALPPASPEKPPPMRTEVAAAGRTRGARKKDVPEGDPAGLVEATPSMYHVIEPVNLFPPPPAVIVFATTTTWCQAPSQALMRHCNETCMTGATVVCSATVPARSAK